MVKNHLKRIAAPQTWRIARKKSTFITRPKPGAHSRAHSISLSILMRELTKVTKSSKEVKYVIHKKEVLVDGTKRHDPKLPVGIMDVVEFPQLAETFRVSLDEKGKLNAIPISDKEKNLKVCMIVNKQWIKLKGLKNKGTKLQIQLNDGRNILLDDDKAGYKTGDSLLLEVPSQKIKECLKFEKGAIVFLLGGKHAGSLGLIEEIFDKNIIFQTQSNEKYETSKKYAFIVGKKDPKITVVK